MASKEELLDNSTVVRCLGVLCLVLGAFLGHSAVYTPIQQAHLGTPELVLTKGAAGATAGSLLCGVIFLAAGRHVKRFLVLNWRTATPLQIAGTLVGAAICILVEIGFEKYLKGLGYSFG